LAISTLIKFFVKALSFQNVLFLKNTILKRKVDNIFEDLGRFNLST